MASQRRLEIVKRIAFRRDRRHARRDHLANVDGKLIAPFVTVYLALMGVLILARALRAFATVEPSKRGMPVIGFVGGMLDAIGGGGWGPIVTSTLIGTGHVPRFVIGSVSLTEFFVTVATSVTLIRRIGLSTSHRSIPLVLGGLVARRSPATWSRSSRPAADAAGRQPDPAA